MCDIRRNFATVSMLLYRTALTFSTFGCENQADGITFVPHR